jgi:secreted Zn-dependent insulinase-like peptidase
VHHAALDGALDIFAQFFIAPLFTASATEREVNAVNNESEFASYDQADLIPRAFKISYATFLFAAFRREERFERLAACVVLRVYYSFNLPLCFCYFLTDEKNVLTDSRRLLQLTRSTSCPQHPFSNFGTGNAETLKTGPAAAGVDVRAALLSFHGGECFCDVHVCSLLSCF